MQIPFHRLYLVSACLVGLCTRYDGSQKPSDLCLSLLREAAWIPVCPEQLGGLSTPRAPANIVGGEGRDVLSGKAKVLTRDGIDVSKAFIHGAHQVLSIAQSQPIDAVFLKSRSPSCGQNGVTAALLRQHGFRLVEFQ
jgi:uncharacterized protein YbbK (DUF523 family)